MAGGWMTDDRQQMRLILAARLSSKLGIGIETQDEYGRSWAERQGHTIVATAPDVKSGKVAPWDRPNLKPWVTRPELMAKYDGILAFKNDRLSRGDWDDEARIRQWASANGKVLVIVDGPQWPPRNDGDRWAWEAAAIQANKEWEEIQERNKRARRALIERGALVGQVPTWAFTITGEKYDKVAVPTEAGRKYIPEIFQQIADGASLVKVAEWANAQGIGSGKLSGRTVQRIIRNPIYMGQRHFKDSRLTVEPLVDARLWTDANDRLANAPRGRRGPSRGETALLTGSLLCPRCPEGGKHAPMYRITAGYSPHRRDYYRCAGHYPLRKGCGNMVDLAATDLIALTALSQSAEPWTELRLVRGENHDIELAEIELALDDLHKRKLPDAAEDAERTRLRAARDELRTRPSIPDRWEEVETGETVGQHFAGLDHDGRRRMLLDNVKFYAESPGPRLRFESRLFTMGVTWVDPGVPEAA